VRRLPDKAQQCRALLPTMFISICVCTRGNKVCTYCCVSVLHM